MSITSNYTATLRTRKVNGSDNYSSDRAIQGYSSDASSNMVGIIHFGGLALSNKVITAIKLNVTSQNLGGSTKTLKIRQSNYQVASQNGVTGANYCGSSIGTLSGVTSLGGSTSYTITGSLLTSLASYFAAGNNTITIYDSNATSSSTNNIGWTKVSIVVTYNDAVSIPTVSSDSIDLGTSVTISTNRTNSSATHTITYTFGSASGTISSNVTESVSWTPALALATQIPSATSGLCTINCTTYLDGTAIGSSFCTLTLEVPTSVKPTISGIVISEAVSGLNSQFHCYVQNKSKLSVSITANGIYGSTIESTSVRTIIDGQTYTGTSFTSGTLKTVGVNLPISVTVTDTRGRETTTSMSIITVKAYSEPSITAFSAERCNAAGSAAQIDGTNVRYSASGSVSAVNNNNTITCKLYYKLSADTVWTLAETITVSDYTISASNVLFSQTFSNLNSYDIKLSVQDYFTTVEQMVSIGTKQVLMDFKGDGTGVAFGTIASNSNTVEIGEGWKLKLSSNGLSETLPITQGGTGQTTAEGIRNTLGLGNTTSYLPIANGGTGNSTKSAARASFGLGNTEGALPIANGGTGSTTAKDACVALGIFYAASLPSTGTEGQICLIPIS